MTGPNLDPSHGKEPTPDTVNSLCLILRSFIQQKMETESETIAIHQIEPRKPYKRAWERIRRIGRVKNTARIPTASTL